MEYQEGICKLCLQIREHCRAIDGHTTDALSVLLPKTDFTVIQGPVVCRNCEEMLIRCNDFKSICLHTFKSVGPPVKKINVKLDLKNATGTGIQEDYGICGFCMGLVKDVSAVSPITLERMIKQCLPELGLSIIEEPLICASCLGSLENCFRFVTSCLIAEENIRKYCDTLNVNCKGEIELSNVLQFISRDVTSEVDGISVDKIKVEKQYCEDRTSPDENKNFRRSDVIKLEFLDDIKHVNEDVKIKDEIFMEMDDKKDNSEHQFTPTNMLELEEESYRLDFIKMEEYCEKNVDEQREENLAETEEQKCLLHDEVHIKTEEQNFNRLKDSIVLPEHEVTTSCNGKQTFLMQNPNSDLTKSYNKQTLTNKIISAITTYNCSSCLYQTKHKRNLRLHSLTHKDASEVTMHRCDVCSYQTKHKRTLKLHLLRHKDPSEVTMHKCDFCSYQTIDKYSLKIHLVNHKDVSEVTMHKCDFCFYETKHKRLLKMHLLKHKGPSEVTMHECDTCLYRTNRKDNLKKHLLRHRNPSEIPMYKCDLCSYQTKFKCSLAIHLQRHKNPPEVEVTTYKCDSCLYQTKLKSSYTVHLRKHKDTSEVNVTGYKCIFCSYQSKFKGNLKIHLLSHKDPSEVTMYRCDSCVFQTKYKNCIKRHLLMHKDPSE